jgi:arsenate reductase
MSTPLTPTWTPPADLTPAERVNIRHSAAALERRWKGQMNVETIERFIAESLDIILPNAKIRTFVPVLVERLTNDRLRALVRLESDQTDLNPSVLFLCVHNAGRSQMAAGWMRHLAGDQVDVFSGGSEPAAELNTAAVAAMAEKGIDISRELPQPWADEIVRAADVIVTMGCGDACPVYPGKRYLDWELDDPAGRPSRRSARSATTSSGGSAASLRTWASTRYPTDRADAHRALLGRSLEPPGARGRARRHRGGRRRRPLRPGRHGWIRPVAERGPRAPPGGPDPGRDGQLRRRDRVRPRRVWLCLRRPDRDGARRPVLRLDEGTHHRRQQGLAAIAATRDPVRGRRLPVPPGARQPPAGSTSTSTKTSPTPPSSASPPAPARTSSPVVIPIGRT